MLCIVWAVLTAAMFLFFFRILDASNQQTVDSMTSEQANLAALQGQKQNYEEAKADLDKLAQQPIQPDDFFSKDITLVNEIQTLQDWSQKLSVKMTLSGISGTINSQPKADTTTPLVKIPYAISLVGSLGQVTAYIEVLENLGFVSNVSGLSVSAGDNGTVSASLSANLYLKD